MTSFKKLLTSLSDNCSISFTNIQEMVYVNSENGKITTTTIPCLIRSICYREQNGMYQVYSTYYFEDCLNPNREQIIEQVEGLHTSNSIENMILNSVSPIKSFHLSM